MGVDTTERRPRYLAPLSRRIETIALRYAWVIATITNAGTGFGFYYDIPQFQLEPVVPDSPTATLFVACSLALCNPDRSTDT